MVIVATNYKFVDDVNMSDYIILFFIIVIYKVFRQ